ncbi:MAG: hypothetical protein AB1772_00380 [Candidatus Zixiibacteriota bacterium]
MSDHPSGYETRDTSIRGIIITSVVTVVVIVILVIAMYDYFIKTREEVFYEQALKPQSPELKELRRIEDSVLTSYELIDSASGTFRIPITQAMGLIATESAGTTSGR